MFPYRRESDGTKPAETGVLIHLFISCISFFPGSGGSCCCSCCLKCELYTCALIYCLHLIRLQTQMLLFYLANSDLVNDGECHCDGLQMCLENICTRNPKMKCFPSFSLTVKTFSSMSICTSVELGGNPTFLLLWRSKVVAVTVDPHRCDFVAPQRLSVAR